MELYLEQPEGYGVAGRENDSCLFKKVHLRLETSFKSVERKIWRISRQVGLIRSKLDPCVYFRPDGNEFTEMCIYVDDGLICSSSTTILLNILRNLINQFEVRSLQAGRFLGLDIKRNRQTQTIFVSQPDSILKI